MENYGKALVPKETRIGVLYGGMSSERDVSLRSGKNCFEALQRLGYTNSVLIDVDKNIAQNLVKEKVELAYIALHGKYGEDGSIQGLLELLQIPYTGCGVSASAISMNKDLTKRILSLENLPLIKSQVVKRDELFGLKLNLNFPLMIKPICEGSSIGMVKVETEENLKESLLYAFKFSSTILIEEFIEGLSITVGVLDIENKTIATPILAIKTKTEWYDYKAKYTQGLTEFELPAKISQSLTNRIKETAIIAHKAVGAKGMSRVDFLIDKNDVPYVLEINTIPGMTDLSDLPAQAKCMGIEYDTLVQIILNSALIKDK